VADGRKKELDYIDSIAQGRVWTGYRGIQVGLVDRIGSLQDAMNCAAGMAKLKEYRITEYPEKKSLLEQLMDNYKKTVKTKLIKEEIGADQLRVLNELKKVKQMMGVPQARLPFMLTVN
jgi:protease-4